MQLLTVGNPKLVKKSAFLCKFHRGLDTSTLIDRFNFEAWQQLTEYFGTQDYAKWDLGLCPAPITLIRIKTTVSHTGFLEEMLSNPFKNISIIEKNRQVKKWKTANHYFLQRKENQLQK